MILPGKKSGSKMAYNRPSPAVNFVLLLFSVPNVRLKLTVPFDENFVS